MVSIDDISVMAGLKRRMQYLSERQAVLAQNVANADTPGYKSKDLKKINFLDEVERSMGKPALATTHPGHIAVATRGGGRFETLRGGDSFETTPAGNAVILEEEMLKMNKTATDYESTTALYRKLTNLMQTAIDGGK